MRRVITGFHQDEVGDWVAELCCLHGQHVRHRPPFQERPWVVDQAGRDQRIGTELDCPLCDRAEPPADLVAVRTIGPFYADTLPAGLQRSHTLAAGTWARVRLTAGSVECSLAVDPPVRERLEAGAVRWLPPEVPHALHVDGPLSLEVDFFAGRRSEGEP